MELIIMFKIYKSIPILLAVTLFLAILPSCKTEEGEVNFDVKHSVNIALPGKGWPIEKKLSPEKLATYKKYGMPDAFHVYWDPTGSVQSSDFVKKELKRRKAMGEKDLPPYAWVYLDKNIEVFFDKNGKASEKPITDKIRIIIQNGDPQKVDQSSLLKWTYYSTGKIYTFGPAGNKVEENTFPAMGGNFTRR